MPGTTNDLIDLKRILKDKYGFKNEDIYILQDKEATQENILRKMNNIYEEAKEVCWKERNKTKWNEMKRNEKKWNETKWNETFTLIESNCAHNV